MQQDIFGRDLNSHGRPHNWADDASDALVIAWESGGRPAAEAKLAELVAQERPSRTALNVAVSRFRVRVGL